MCASKYFASIINMEKLQTFSNRAIKSIYLDLVKINYIFNHFLKELKDSIEKSFKLVD